MRPGSPERLSQDEELLPQQRVLRDQLGLAAEQIGAGSRDECRLGGLHRRQEATVKRLKDIATGSGNAAQETSQHSRLLTHEAVVRSRRPAVAPSRAVAATVNRPYL